jgi:parallel beta-helix repeat protein
MNNIGMIFGIYAGLAVCSVSAVRSQPAQYHPAPFVHPGISQSLEDLAFMKQKALAGEQPWKDALERLEAASSPDFQPKPFTHVIRGPFGRPSIGGTELTASANAAYNHALLWYITGEQAHADKAIAILNTWSSVLWDFDDNDAKLLAGWTGHVFCDAAEILRSGHSGWKPEDIRQFKKMLLTAYYPLIKDFFPEANGNWDAALMHTVLSIAVFCDDHPMFDKVIDHFMRARGNGGVTKYIYPDGQCEESTRDQGHTQLGLGELAGVCQVAWTQGVDLFGAAGNRMALGFEYTARYMLGGDVPVYGTIVPKGRDHFSDIYAFVYAHYRTVDGMEMPFTKQAADSARSHSSVMELTAYRAPRKTSALRAAGAPRPPLHAAFPDSVGAGFKASILPPSGSVTVEAGGDIQAALDRSAGSGGWVVLDKGVYTLHAALRIPSRVTLAGQGRETILFLDPAAVAGLQGTVLVNAADSLHDVTLRDLVVEGAVTVHTSSDPNQDRRVRASQMAPSRAGIAFSALRYKEMKNIRLVHLTVRHCTHSGVVIQGAEGVFIEACDFSDNGAAVAPGPELLHNLLLSYVSDAQINNNRLDDSPWGCGIAVRQSDDIRIAGNEAARNAGSGIRVTDSRQVRVADNLAEGNDDSGILFDAEDGGCKDIDAERNLSWYNGKKDAQ